MGDNMEVFVARQPIFNKKLKVFAYELLYRDEKNNNYIDDGDKATSNVVMNSFLSIGFETLTDNKKAFVNFTYNLIVDDFITLFPKDKIVVELLEDIKIDENIIAAIRNLKELGYTIALDDFSLKNIKKYKDIIEYIDILKVDFLLNEDKEIKAIPKLFNKMLNNKKIIFLAEKIESIEELNKAIRYGYTLFQGFFFSKPITIKGKTVSTSKLNCMKILKELSNNNPNYDNISNVVEKDISLSYNLLKLINSSAFYRGNKITSIKQALVYLGFKEIKKWVSLLLLRDVNKDNPDEVMKATIIRGKLAELIASKINLEDRKSEAFLLGIFSMIDIIINMPISDLINDLPLNEDVKLALLGEENNFKDILDIIKAYEKGDWNNILKYISKYNITSEYIFDSYVEALNYINDINKSLNSI